MTIKHVTLLQSYVPMIYIYKYYVKKTTLCQTSIIFWRKKGKCLPFSPFCGLYIGPLGLEPHTFSILNQRDINSGEDDKLYRFLPSFPFLYVTIIPTFYDSFIFFKKYFALYIIALVKTILHKL